MSTYKRVIICCDGTWQQSDGSHSAPASNVTKLHRAIAQCEDLKNGSEIQQIVKYQSGIGTHSLWKVSSHIEAAFGIGLAEQVLEAYSFLVDNFDNHGSQPDEIFLFGFSRGAFTVRCLAGLVDCIGILPKARMEKEFHLLYERYMAHEAEELKKQQLGLPVKIKVIGIWDTVGALGVPDFLDEWLPMLDLNRRHKFHRPMLSSNIENAFQALALDECRRTFSPLLWYIPRDDADTMAQSINLVQCWFPGVHVEVGGGGRSTNAELLSDISLFWMLDLLAPFLNFDQNYLESLIKRHCDNVRDTPEPDQGWLDHLFARGYHRSDVPHGWAVGPTHKSIGIGSRTPGHYYPPEDSIDIPTQTREMMHPSVRVRHKVLQDKWHPAALHGFDLRQGTTDGSSWSWKQLRRGKSDVGPLRSAWQWVSESKHGAQTVIPEYCMTGEWERKLARDCPIVRCGAMETAWSVLSQSF